MTEVNITNTDVDALAAKIDGMADQFSEHELVTLGAVFSLAQTGVASLAGDVEGFAYDAFNQGTNFSLNFTLGAHGTGGGGGAGKVSFQDLHLTGGQSYKLGGQSHKLGGAFHKE